MAPLRKILICPYFGPFPEWMSKFEWPKGYHMIIDTDLEGFKLRVKEKLGIDYPGVYGGSKVWDYRCALGLLYEDEIKDYDFWGHCDFDVVFGDMDKFVPDSVLNELDVYSGHDQYVCGCFSLYRNSPEVNNLFKKFDGWEVILKSPEAIGWVETDYSRLLENSGLRYKYEFKQGDPWVTKPTLKKEGNKLTQHGPQFVKDICEVAFFHFRHSKRWPL